VHLSPKLPFGWVDFPPCMNRLIGLRWLAKILYPDAFPEDLRALTRDFYARFYHVSTSPNASTPSAMIGPGRNERVMTLFVRQSQPASTRSICASLSPNPQVSGRGRYADVIGMVRVTAVTARNGVTRPRASDLLVLHTVRKIL
jgi:hypothetical protein